MSQWAAKRFWTETSVAEAEGGWTVMLDTRTLRTPAKATLVVPTRAYAEAVAAEWAAQEGVIRPETMPLTRSANAAIDKVAAQHDEVAGLIAAYGETDLLCYRADGPAALARRQTDAWDPLLDWVADSYGARLVPVSGVMPEPQDDVALAHLAAATHAFDPFELAAFHDLVSLSGSLVLGFAAVAGYGAPEALWEISRIDETWQAEQWGEDEEAAEHAALKRQAFLTAAHIYSLLQRD